MKKVLFHFFILTLLCCEEGNITHAAAIKDLNPSSSASEAPGPPASDLISVGYLSAPPHVYLDEKSHKLKGAIYDLLENHIAPEIGVRFQWDTNPTTIPLNNYIDISKLPRIPGKTGSEP